MKRLIILAIVLLFVSCDSGTEESLPPPEFDFTGTWAGDITGATTATSFTITATQTGGAIAGTLWNDAGYTFSISGSASGSNISLTGVDITDPSYKIFCSGTCDGSNAYGTWSDTYGQHGDWAAVKI